MYHADMGINTILRKKTTLTQSQRRISATIYFIGLTSLLTDISAEMVASILPIYLLTVLRLSPMEFGMIDGLFNGSTAVISLIAAHLSDRWKKHKAIATVGYFLSTLSRTGWLIAGVFGATSVMAVILVDRIGKGIRTAPRDALIAGHAPPDAIGAAFGIHRAMDAIGAVIGPLLATGILLWLPQQFNNVFLTSICFSLLGLLAIGLLVTPPKRNLQTHTQETAPIRIATTLQVLKAPRFLWLMLASTLLALFTLSDNMIYLGLQQKLQIPLYMLPLLYASTAIVFMTLAIPLGRLADRVGAHAIFLLGYGCLALVYCLFAVLPPIGRFDLVFYIGLLGLYYAATDGVIMTLAAQQLPESLRATGMACIATFISLGRFGSSVLFGWLWQHTSQERAVGYIGIAMVIALFITLCLHHIVSGKESRT